jgi:pyruvate/2-oxoglutarate/acetoin dehydrogenase E1 component
MKVAENINQALHAALAADDCVYLLGEDIADPYGGAFKITKGLSTRFPGRVLSTPISEAAITGVAAGIALSGGSAIVEMMFGDFVGLAFDQIVNFASKSVSMYGARVSAPLIVRCPSGGRRGYGPTHSQTLMKHFIGVPGLALYEMSPFHDATAVFAQMLSRGEPCLFFEDKVLYTRTMHDVVEPLRWHMDGSVAVVGFDDNPDCVILAPGGVAHRAIDAARSLLLDEEINAAVVVPSQLYPFDCGAVPEVGFVFVAEESTAGGTWGAQVAAQLHAERWPRLKRPVGLISSADSVIPAAAHLERDVLISASTIHRAVAEAMRG